MKLTVKQEHFCNIYLETGNATEAYRQAYDCGNMKYDTIVRKAMELVKNGNITAWLDTKRSELNERSDIRKQEILEELKSIAFADIADYVDFDGASLSIKSFEDMTPAQRRAIEYIRKTKHGVEIRLHGKNWSIDRICKMLGFDAPVVMEQKVNTGFEGITKEEIQERLKRMVANGLQNDSKNEEK